MSLRTSLQSAWQKNGPEIRGLFDGALPTFVWSPRPSDQLQGIPVFCYHLVDTDEFEADLQYLSANGYVTVLGSDLVRILAEQSKAPERTVALTFDDGPRNFFDVSFPLLVKYRSRATAFVAPALHAEARVEADIEDRPMTWQEIETIHRSGLVEFQSHTLESRFVPRWPEPVALCGCNPTLERERRGAPLPLLDDLVRSRQILESRLPGAVVNQLAFPAYLGTPETIDVARTAGIGACYWGLRSGRGLNRPGDSPQYISRLSGEFLRRLPGTGRISLPELIEGRLRRAAAAREWRRRQAAQALS